MDRDTLQRIVDSKEDARPWRCLSSVDWSQLLEVHLKHWDAAVDFAAEVKVDGIEDRLDGMPALSAHGPAFHTVAFHLAENATDLWTAMQTAEKLSKRMAWVVSKAHAQGFQVQYGFALQLVVLKRYLDIRFGAGRWRFDPDAVMVKDLGTQDVFKLTEEATQQRLLLAIEGDEVLELARTDGRPA